MSVITIERKVLEKNDEIARRNRALFDEYRILAVNLVSSPGSGKTSLLERTLEYLRPEFPIAVIEGDVQTDLDAQRIARFHVPVVQIVTNGGCHLEAKLVEDALAQVDLAGVKLLLIENVGNLVCPAHYDLGEHMKVVVVSTTEGDDKPLKYPSLFQRASAVVINKMDLVPYLPTNPEELKANALRINPKLTVFETSCTTRAGLAEWCNWLTSKIVN